MSDLQQTSPKKSKIAGQACWQCWRVLETRNESLPKQITPFIAACPLSMTNSCFLLGRGGMEMGNLSLEEEGGLGVEYHVMPGFPPWVSAKWQTGGRNETIFILFFACSNGALISNSPQYFSKVQPNQSKSISYFPMIKTNCILN